MGGRGSSSSLERRTSEEGLTKRAEEIHKILKDAGMPAKKSIEETKDMLRDLDKRNGYTTTISKNKASISIGGITMKTEKDIDNYYNAKYKKDKEILETSNAMNKALGTSGGFRIGNKVFKTTKELQDHYKKEAQKSKDMLKNL